jgi:hypothetical protein
LAWLMHPISYKVVRKMDKWLNYAKLFL